jgi:hypothetical protein
MTARIFASCHSSAVDTSSRRTALHWILARPPSRCSSNILREPNSPITKSLARGFTLSVEPERGRAQTDRLLHVHLSSRVIQCTVWYYFIIFSYLISPLLFISFLFISFYFSVCLPVRVYPWFIFCSLVIPTLTTFTLHTPGFTSPEAEEYA